MPGVSAMDQPYYTPVSYTHLDVYKRQGYTYSPRDSRTYGYRLHGLFRNYLDVYKRQRRFYESLVPGGTLFVGSTEQIVNYRELGYISERSFFYKKPE